MLQATRGGTRGIGVFFCRRMWFDSIPVEPLTLIFSAYESFGFRKWRARARAGVEAAAISAGFAALLRAGERRNRRRGGVRGRGPAESGVDYELGHASAAG